MNKLRLSLVLSILSLVLFSANLKAKDGYKIQVNFTDLTKDSKLFLCHYYGKGGTVFKDDSTTLKSGKGLMQSKEKIEGRYLLITFC